MCSFRSFSTAIFGPLQCDQQRPQCTRCIDARIQCCGYRDEFDILYRDEREKTKARVIAPKIQSASSKPGLVLAHPLKRESSPKGYIFMPYEIQEMTEYFRFCRPEIDRLWMLKPADLPAPISTSENCMINFFSSQFVEPARSSRWPGWLSQLPEQYAAAPNSPCFKPALLAASHTVLHKKQKNPTYQNIAREFYDKGLEAI